MSNWISVKDRLPEVGEKVLCYTTSRMSILYTWSDGDIEVVTHWQVLPEPPKGGE